MPVEVAQDHRVLKRVVIGLGVLLVVGTIALMVLVAKKTKSAAPAAPAASDLPAELAVELPAGDVIDSVALGATEFALSVSGSEGRRILIVDRRTGKVRQSLSLQAVPP